MKNILLLFLSLLFIIIRHDKTPEDYLANAEEFNHVVPLKLKDAIGIIEMEGIFIAENWIITAAHGLESVENNQNVTINNVEYRLTHVVAHPGWNGRTHDIGLLKVEGGSENRIYPKLYKTHDELDKEITIVGRGQFGTGISGPVKDDGVFRIATNKIDKVSDHWIAFRFDAPDDPRVTRLEGVSGPGDSGGPAFIRVEGENYLAGISSHQFPSKPGAGEGLYGAVEYYTRVSHYIEWIQAVMSGKYSRKETVLTNENNLWGFPDTNLGQRATHIMNALVNKQITKKLIDDHFHKKFQRSTNIPEFLTVVSGLLRDPVIKEFKKVKEHLITFTVQSGEALYFFQIDGEKRNNHQVGGMIVKKL